MVSDAAFKPGDVASRCPGNGGSSAEAGARFSCASGRGTVWRGFGLSGQPECCADGIETFFANPDPRTAPQRGSEPRRDLVERMLAPTDDHGATADPLNLVYDAKIEAASPIFRAFCTVPPDASSTGRTGTRRAGCRAHSDPMFTNCSPTLDLNGTYSSVHWELAGPY
jgi:hypothetical protein